MQKSRILWKLRAPVTLWSLYVPLTWLSTLQRTDIEQHFICNLSLISMPPDCRDFVRAMICADPDERATLDELKHMDWLNKPIDVSTAAHSTPVHSESSLCEYRPIFGYWVKEWKYGFQGILWDFFIFTLEQIIVLNNIVPKTNLFPKYYMSVITTELE